MNPDPTTTLVSLDHLAGGGVSERVAYAQARILANIADPNTPATKPRKLTVELIYTPREDRQGSKISVMVDAKLQPRRAVETEVIHGVDPETGEVVMQEITKQIPGQVSMDGDVVTPNVRTFPGLRTGGQHRD